MDIRGVVPLDAESLIRSAVEATGLSDFGTSEWEEPFRALTSSMDEDADLNLMGRLRTRSEILQLLDARLRIEETYRLHPEIEDEEIAAPLFVVGQSRSGTSMLLNMLAQDPDTGVLKHWEAVFPCPPPEAATYLTDPRIERAHKLVDQWTRVTPTLASMHEFAGELPMECCVILGMTFMSPSWFDSMGQVQGYDRFMANCDMTAAFRYHRRVLKLLQWRNPRKRWALKDPTHLDRIEALMAVYPDARIVWPHRDPSKAQSSVVSLLGTVQWGRTDHPFRNGSFDFILDPGIAAARLDGFIEKIERGVVPQAQLFNLHYADLVSDPLSEIEALYRAFSIEMTPEARTAIAAYVAANPREARPKHEVGKASDAELAGDDAVFRHYRNYFGIPRED